MGTVKHTEGNHMRNEHAHPIFANVLNSISPLCKPDLSHEQNGPLNADAVNLKALIDHADVLLAAAYAALGKSITRSAEGALDDFHGGLSDLRSDLQAMYDVYDAELDSRDAVLEREHERTELARIRE